MSAPASEQQLAEGYRLLVADVYELAGTSRRSSEELAREVGQTAARWHLMSVVSAGELTVSQAARRLGLARQSVQRVAGDLVRDGQLHSRPDESDRRAPLFSLTESGRRVLARLVSRSEAGRVAAIRSAGVSADDLAQARRTIRALVAALQAEDDAGG